MDESLTPGFTPELKLWILIGFGCVLMVAFAVLVAYKLVPWCDPRHPDEEELLLTRRQMHQAGGASVEDEIIDEAML